MLGLQIWYTFWGLRGGFDLAFCEGSFLIFDLENFQKFSRKIFSPRTHIFLQPSPSSAHTMSQQRSSTSTGQARSHAVPTHNCCSCELLHLMVEDMRRSQQELIVRVSNAELAINVHASETAALTMLYGTLARDYHMILSTLSYQYAQQLAAHNNGHQAVVYTHQSHPTGAPPPPLPLPYN
jgi:hypothetical protein